MFIVDTIESLQHDVESLQQQKEDNARAVEVRMRTVLDQLDAQTKVIFVTSHMRFHCFCSAFFALTPWFICLTFSTSKFDQAFIANNTQMYACSRAQ